MAKLVGNGCLDNIGDIKGCPKLHCLMLACSKDDCADHVYDASGWALCLPLTSNNIKIKKDRAWCLLLWKIETHLFGRVGLVIIGPAANIFTETRSTVIII